eukprot:s64_g28.t1
MQADVQGDRQCHVSTELDVMEAMTRRSLAFDVVGLVNYEATSPQSRSTGFREDASVDKRGHRTEARGFLDSIVEKLPQDHTVMYYMLPTRAPAAHPKLKAKPEAKKEWST